MSKKNKKNAAKVDVKKENKLAPASKIEPKKPEAPKVDAAKGPERPKLPADFCLDKSDWEGNSTCFDPTSNNCKVCKKDFPATQSACSARTDYLLAAGKVSKAKKLSTGERKTKNGVPTQTNIINTMLGEKKPLTEIIAAVAKAHYSDNEAGRSVGSGRVNRHIKSIKDGSCKNATALLATIAYLSKPVAKAVAAKK